MKAKMLYWMLSATILVDYINGIVPAFKLGIIFRLVLIATCLAIIFLGDKKKFQIMMAVYAFLVAGSLISFLKHKSFYGIYYDFSMMLKTTCCLVILFAMICLFKSGEFSKKTVEKVLFNNMVYMPALFLISKLLNIGGASYVDVNVGFRATFLSLNSINTAMVVLFVYVVFKYVHTRKKEWLFAIVYVAVPLLLLGTKTGLIVVAVVPVLSILLNFHNEKGKKMAASIGIVGGAAVLLFGKYIYAAMKDIVSRQLYLFLNRDIFSYLFSGRNWMLSIGWDYYLENTTFLEKIFGQGYYLPHNALATITEYTAANVRPIEMDWADLMIAYGVWGLLFTYVPILYLLIKTWRKLREEEVQNYYCSILLLVGFGSLAGHVFTEAISSTFLAIAAAGLYAASGLTEEDFQFRVPKRKMPYEKE